MTNPATRPLAHLNNLAQRHPSVWKGVEYLRSLRGTQLPITAYRTGAGMGQIARQGDYQIQYLLE